RLELRRDAVLDRGASPDPGGTRRPARARRRPRRAAATRRVAGAARRPRIVRPGARRAGAEGRRGLPARRPRRTRPERGPRELPRLRERPLAGGAGARGRRRARALRSGRGGDHLVRAPRRSGRADSTQGGVGRGATDAREGGRSTAVTAAWGCLLAP